MSDVPSLASCQTLVACARYSCLRSVWESRFLDVIDDLFDETEMLRQGSVPPIATGSRLSEDATENLVDVTEEINAIERELKRMKRRQQLGDDEANRWKMKYQRLRAVVLFACLVFVAYMMFKG